MSATTFDWSSVSTGQVHADGVNYRWKRGDVHVVFATELPEMLVFIDRLTLTFLYPAEVHGLTALLKGTAESVTIGDGLEIREGIAGGLSIGGDLDTVEIGLTDEEAAALIEGLTALLPYMDAAERHLDMADAEHDDAKGQ